MKIKYDEDIEIEVEDLITHLETYAKAVMYRMQKVDTEFADCWTACLITFKGLQPEFEFGDAEHVDDEGGVYIELPLDAPKAT